MLNLYAAISMTGGHSTWVKYKLVGEERGINSFRMKAIRGLSREVDTSWWPDPALK